MQPINTPYPDVVPIVRHAESVGNVLSREAQRKFPMGTNFYELSQLGKEQARITGEWMREHFPHPDRVIASYYQRAQETARYAYPHLVIRDDSLLAERDRGIWTNATEEQVQRCAPWEIDRRDQQGPYHYRPMGGESMPDVEQRARHERRSLQANYRGKLPVLFTHSQWLLCLMKVVQGWDVQEFMRRFEAHDWAENASVTIFRNHFDPERNKYVLVHNPETDYHVPWKGQL